MLPLLAVIDVVDSEVEPLIAFSSNNRCQASNTFESASALLTALAETPARPTLVAQTTQGSHSTASSVNPKIGVLCSPADELPMKKKEDAGSDISETRAEADIFHQKFSEFNSAN